MKSKKLGNLREEIFQKGILRSSTGLLRTYNREELNQFLRRYLIENLHLSHLSLKRVFGWWKFLGDCSCLLLCKDSNSKVVWRKVSSGEGTTV